MHIDGEEDAGGLTNPSGVESVDAKPPGTVLASTMSHERVFCQCCQLSSSYASQVGLTDELVEAFGSAQAGRAGANHKHIDIATFLSAHMTIKRA